MNARAIDRLALGALLLLVVSYTAFVGDEASPSAGWAWLTVATILLGANLARRRIGAKMSPSGVAVGSAALALGILRVVGVVAEVSLPLAAITVVAPLALSRLLVSRRRSAR